MIVHIDEITDRIAKIVEAALLRDYEVAHSLEDELHVDVLASIASGLPGQVATKFAAYAIQTRDIKFQRHCA